MVGFAQIPETGVHLASLSDGTRMIPLLFQGLAWIDTRSHEIVRLQIDLLSSPPHAQLQKETTQIEFAPVHLPQTTATFMLPQRVVVDAWQDVSVLPASSAGQESTRPAPRRGGIEPGSGSQDSMRHCRNIHTYSDYKLFRVNSRIGPAS